MFLHFNMYSAILYNFYYYKLYCFCLSQPWPIHCIPCEDENWTSQAISVLKGKTQTFKVIEGLYTPLLI